MLSDCSPVLELERVSKCFGKTAVLKEVNLSVSKKEVVGLIGPNGAGKTTVLRIAAGFLLPDGGDVKFHGHNVEPNDDDICLGYLPEKVPLYDSFSVERYLGFVAALKPIPLSDRAECVDVVMKSFDLVHVRKKVIGTLSKGYRQRVGLSQAFLGKPDLLILDEPTAGLDPFQLVDTRDMILEAARNKAVLFSTHVIREVEMMCTRAVFLNESTISEIGFSKKTAPYIDILISSVDVKTLEKELYAKVGNCIIEIRSIGARQYRLLLDLQIQDRGRVSRLLANLGDLQIFQESKAALEDRILEIKEKRMR